MADAPAYEEIKISRVLGRGIVVDTAPEHVKIHVTVLSAHHVDLTVEPDGRLTVGNQVGYDITGYDPADCTLTLRLAMDWRPGQKDDPDKRTAEDIHG